MTSDALLGTNTGFVVGFGSSGPSVDLSLGPIDLNLFPNTNMAFSMPRDGTLVQLSAVFRNAVGLLLPPGTGLVVVVEIYRSTAIGLFSPTGVGVSLPLLDGILQVGESSSATAAFALAVSNEDRLLLVARAVPTGGLASIPTITGYISAGLAIA